MNDLVVTVESYTYTRTSSNLMVVVDGQVTEKQQPGSRSDLSTLFHFPNEVVAARRC